MTDAVPIKKYLKAFFIVYSVLSVIFGLITAFAIDMSAIIVVILPFICAMVVGVIFVRDTHRTPTDAERDRLAKGSLLIYIVCNVVLWGVALMFFTPWEISQPFGEFAASDMKIIIPLALIAFALLSLVIYALMRTIYGALKITNPDKLPPKKYE